MKKILLALITITAATTACNDDYFDDKVSNEYSDKIGYNVKIIDESDDWKSRGASGAYVSVERLDATIGGKDMYLHTVITDTIPQSILASKKQQPASRGSITSTEDVDEIAVSAIVINDSDDEKKGWPAVGQSQMYMNNERITSGWATGRYWPQEQDSIRFYAYAPVDALNDETIDYQVGLPAISNAEPVFYYRVNDDIESQQDLLVATAQYRGNYCKEAKLNFRHALTAVEIHLSKEIEGFTLHELTISGIENEGFYGYKFIPILDEAESVNARESGSWSSIDTDGKQSYTLYKSDTGLELNGTKEVNLSENNLVLMMMPQELTEDAIITLKGHDNVLNDDIELTACIGGNGKKWNKGEHVVYTLTFNQIRIEYILEVTPSKSLDENGRYISPWHGESNIEYNVRSYKRTYQDGGFHEDAIEWEIDESTVPSWVDHITLSGGDNATCTYSVLPNLTSSVSHNELSTRPQCGTEENPWDLSRNQIFNEENDPYETANCYMVTAPGWYTFPLVVGNAISGGQDNKAAYQGDINGTGTPCNSDKNARAYFVNVETSDKVVPVKTLQVFIGNKQIETPWIVTNNGRPGKSPANQAEIVWQDEPCLVTDVKLSKNKDYIIFRVPQISINEGNAVISISLDSSTTPVWSWHIWVTDMIDRCSGFGEVYFENRDVSLTNRFVSSGWNANATTPSGWGSTREYTFGIMPSNIGACDADTKTYTEATANIKFKLIEEGNEVAVSTGVAVRKGELKIGINGNSIYMPDNAPYYQFGRKDPMLPGIGEKKDKPVYLNDRSAKIAISQDEYQDKFGIYFDGINFYGNDNGTRTTHTTISLDMAHNNPEYFFKGYGDDESTTTGLMYETWGVIANGEQDYFINMWDATFNKMPVFSHADINNPVDYYNALNEKDILDRQVVKTVYDPCPPGYEMPRFDAFTGFTFDGMNLSPFLSNGLFVDGVNVDNTVVNYTGSELKGLRFYTKPMPSKTFNSASSVSSDRLFIHAIGHRSKTGDVASYNKFANSLTATPMCVRWIENNKLNPYYKFQGCRLCIIGNPNYSLRMISTSSFDLAFPVMPAKTGCNPDLSKTKVSTGKTDWSGDNNKVDVNF